MKLYGKNWLCLIALAAAAPAIGACSSDGLSNLRLLPSSETILAKPDWVTFSGGHGATQLRAVMAEDLVGPGGECAGAEPEPTVVASAPDTAQGGDPPNNSAIPAASSYLGRGIALQMTECDVVRRAGATEQVNIGNEGGERVVVLTYLRGPWPGIYRFAGGRLLSVERAPVTPTAPKPQKKGPAKKAKAPGRA